ncbi:unnamed protein product [Phytophthora fragariaefolia]|uniref:Unnamed protein product n=1 Tax=Phytophthora fragariaefolia TaxID=1490495 RepID=A0A9W6XW64_9STRA|nr:unnamed protein product [Phytophthora fragariaefolia]
MVAAGISSADILAWSLAMNEAASSPDQDQNQAPGCASNDRRGRSTKVQEETSHNWGRSSTRRVRTRTTPGTKTQAQEDPATNLSATWYEWYTKVPPVWSCDDRQKKSEYRHVVAFMKLFLVDGLDLDANAPDYKDRVLETGRRAESAVLAFLKARGVNSKGTGSVLRSLRPLHRSGELDQRIVAYKILLATERILDPAPQDTQDILGVVGHV